jgi:LAS superfamily LD-carboxypeptidase LdcB
MSHTIPLIILTALFLADWPAQEALYAAEMQTARGKVHPPVQLPETEEAEFVTIGDTSYPIPEPWIGNRIEAPVLTFESFARIPPAYTHEQSAIYVIKEIIEPLVAMCNTAKDEGIHLLVRSGYRSERYQRGIFVRLLAEGRTFEDIIRYVAPPGYSQHALGTAVDFYPSNWRFADTGQYEWLRENADRFGFTETYSQYNRLRIPWESWHWNYTGAPDSLVQSDTQLTGNTTNY